MKRKLLALNLVLVAVIVAASWRLRLDWIALHARGERLQQYRVRPTLPPPINVGPPPQPVGAVSYSEIAQKMVFSKDRNPNVVVEAPKLPPPKPMPHLPLLYGVLNLMDSTTAVMAEDTRSPHRGVRLGEQIGEFTLVAVNREEITLEWDGKPVTRRIDEMLIHEAPTPPPTPGPPAPGAAPRTSQPAPTASSTPPPKTDAAPGVDAGGGIRACQPGDASPAGTVSNGYRKIVQASPFGAMCRWEPI